MNTGEGANQPKQLDIRKYPNRRYYDATHSKHLTLEEIRNLVHDGYDIKVTDSKTGADITAQLLTQIILELETPKLESFPVNMLVQMIRANERVVGDFIHKYFDQAFTAYMDYQKQMEEQFRHFQGFPGPAMPFGGFNAAMFNPFANATRSAPPPPKAEAAQTESGSGPDVRAIIAELQKQVAALQQQLKKSERKPER